MHVNSVEEMSAPKVTASDSGDAVDPLKTTVPIKVSVIIPVYNSQEFIGSCLQQVLAQSLQEIEVVCVDDGSTDDSADIIAQAAQRDSRVKLIQQENAGPGPARNVGIAAATGQFVTFLDADDRYSSDDYLRVLYEGAIDNGVDVSGACFYNDHAGRLEKDFSNDPDLAGYTFTESGVKSYRDYQFDYGFHRFMFKSSLFELASDGAETASGNSASTADAATSASGGATWPFPALTFFEDPIFLAQTLYRAGRFFATNKVGYCYRCDYKVPHWTTKKTADLLEGVRRNLEFSKEQGLPLLHWYTARHYQLESAGVGLGVNPEVSVQQLANAIVAVEQQIDRGMLAQVNLAYAEFESPLKMQLQDLAQAPSWKTRLGAVGYSVKHNKAVFAARGKLCDAVLRAKGCY